MFKNKLPLIIGQAELMFWQFRFFFCGGGGGGRLYLLCKLRLRRKKILAQSANRYISLLKVKESAIYLSLVHSVFYNSGSPLVCKWSKFA